MMSTAFLRTHALRRLTSLRSLTWLPVVALLLVTACRGSAPRTPFDANDPSLTAQRLEEYLRAHPDDTDAWRDLAHIRWLHLGDTDAAVPLLDGLAGDGDPVGRMSRMIIARSRGEAEIVQSLAFDVLRDAAAAEGSEQRLQHALAEYASRQLGQQHGDLPGDDERVTEFYDGLNLEALPFWVNQPLMSLRAAIARRHGEDYRPYYVDQGCVQQWSVGPVQGSSGAVELSRLKTGALTIDPEASAIPLACVVRLWNPTPSPGVRRVVSHIEARGGSVLLDLGAGEPARFYVDGTLVHRTDGIDRYVANRVMLRLSLEAGWHQLEVHTAIPAERTWVLTRALEDDGTPMPTAEEAPGALATPFTGRPRRIRGPWPEALPGVEGPIYAPLRAYLAVEDALADGDSDHAERQLSRLSAAERFPQGHWMRARFERGDPSRGRTVSLSREVEALEDALALDPKLDEVQLRMLAIQRERGEDAEVEQALRAMPDEQLASIDGLLLRFSVFLAQGNEYLAEQALDRAAERSPKSCKVMMAQRALARERADVRREDEIAVGLEQCAGSLSLRARLAEARGRWDEAKQLWDLVLARTPDDLQAHESLARIQALRGDLPQAREHLRTSLRFNPFRVGSHLALADLAVTHGDPKDASDELSLALAKIPQSNALWRSAANLGLSDDLMRWRIDGQEALASYRKSGATYEGVGEVLVLDRSVARVYPNGGQRQIVHIMAHLLSKEALDDYGELGIPDGAELLTLRTIKPDGAMLEPEIVPGKEGVSLRNLELGDVVEYEYVVERGPAGAVPGYVDVSTFRFQSADVPYHRTELLVVHPDSIALRFDSRNNPPVDDPSVVKVDGETLQVHHFRAEEVPRLGVEPGMRSWLDELPSVHVYSRLDLPRYLDGLAAQIRETQRRNPELRRMTRQLVRGHETDRGKLEALWTWVVENVEDAGDLSSPASTTLAARTGSRLMLLRAMLREAGLPAELWLARDGYGPAPVPDGHPLVESYEAAMLAVKLPNAEDPVMVMTASKVMPLGYLAPGYRKTDGLRIQLEPHEGPSGPVTLPGIAPILDDVRVWDVTFELDRQGAGTVRGEIILQGMEAVMWRQALRQIDRDRIEEVFQQAELGWLPGATLSTLSIAEEDAIDKPLILKFSARASGVGVTQDGALVLRAAPMPLNPGAPFAGLPTRSTGMVVPYAPALLATLRYRLQSGVRFDSVPDPESISAEPGSFVREVEGKAGDQKVTLRLRSELNTGVVLPQDYGELAGFVRAVDTAVQDVLRAR